MHFHTRRSAMQSLLLSSSVKVGWYRRQWVWYWMGPPLCPLFPPWAVRLQAASVWSGLGGLSFGPTLSGRLSDGRTCAANRPGPSWFWLAVEVQPPPQLPAGCRPAFSWPPYLPTLSFDMFVVTYLLISLPTTQAPFSTHLPGADFRPVLLCCKPPSEPGC